MIMYLIRKAFNLRG